MDINALRRLLQSGGVTEDALRGMTLSGSFDGGGATSSFDPSGADPGISSDPVALARALQMGQLTATDVGNMGPTSPLAKLLQTIPQQDQNYGDQPSRTGEQVQNALRAYMDAGDQPERTAMQLRPQGAQDLSGYGTADQPSRTMDRYARPPTTLGQNFPDQVSRNTEQLSRNNPQVQETDPYAQPGGPMRLNTMRTETGPNAGHVISLDFTGANGQQAQGGQGRMMQVIGVGHGTTVNLPPEQMNGKPNIDLSRAPVDVMGAKAYYSKDEPGVAYVMGPNGTKKVILGYDMQGSMALNKYNLDQQKTQADVAHTQEETRASKANNPDVLGEGGDINTLNPAVQAQVQAIARGDAPLPATRNGRMSPLALLAYQVNPALTATTYAEKLATVQDFSPKGKSGQAVQGINQALHHAAEASDRIDELNNTNIAPGIINPALNYFQQKVMGDTRQGQLTTAFNALGEELKKAYGGGSLAELENWQKSLDPNAGLAQQKASLAEAMRLLEGAAQSRSEAYKRGTGTPLEFGTLLDAPARAALLKLEGGKHAAGFGVNAGPGPSVGSQSGADPLVVVAPDGSRHKFPTPMAAQAFRQAIGA